MTQMTLDDLSGKHIGQEVTVYHPEGTVTGKLRAIAGGIETVDTTRLSDRETRTEDVRRWVDVQVGPWIAEQVHPGTLVELHGRAVEVTGQ